ncbi:MAG: hypothetical protein ACLRZ9_02650 [Eubacterium sp.]
MKNKINKLTLTLVFTMCCLFFATFTVNAAEKTLTTTTSDGKKTTVTLKTLAGYNADSTYIKFSNNGKTHIAVLDLGDNASVDNLIGKSKSITIDYLIISHKHADHVQGLANLVKKAKSGVAITIDHLYVNGLDFSTSEALGKRLGELNSSKVKIKNVHYFGVKGKAKTDTSSNAARKFFEKWKNGKVIYENSIKTITVTGTGCQIIILPALKDFGTTTTAENNNSLVTVIKDNTTKKNNTKNKNFKIILPGDIQGNAMAQICSTTEYTNYLKKDGFKNVIYKISHHGKGRQHDFFNKVKKEDCFIYDLIDVRAGRVPSLDYGLLLEMKNDLDPAYANYSFGSMFTNERNLIKLIQPNEVIGTKWPGRTVDDKWKDIRRGINIYRSFINDTVKRNGLSKITLKDSFGGNTVTNQNLSKK